MTRTIASTIAALSLVSAPVAAQSVDRVAAPIDDAQGLGGGFGGAGIGTPLLLLIAGVASVLGLILLDDSDDDAVPVSP